MRTQLSSQDLEKAREEAAEWLARRDRGLSPEERAEMREWARDPANQQVLLDMARCWHGMDSMSVLAELFPLGTAADAQRPRPALPLTAIAAAAVFVVAIGAVFLAGRRAPDVSSAPQAAQANPAQEYGRYSTPIGESLTVRPRDGSVITLNTGSALTVQYSEKARDVFLERGEANFDVAHDPSRPFNVHVGERVLQAVGTAFNVRVLAPDNIELTVTEGKVKVLAAHAATTPDVAGEAALEPVQTTVAAHEIVTMRSDGQFIRTADPAEIDARLAWQRGMLIFKGEPLEFVLSEIDRYTETEFVLADEQLRTVRVGGYFRTGDIEGLLEALRMNFGIDSRREGAHRIILSAATAR